MARQFSVAFASIEVRGLFGAELTSFKEALKNSWVPGEDATRYGRRWIVSRIHEIEPNLWSGRIGFVRENELESILWDRERQDFVTSAVPSGVLVPFALDLAVQRIAYQLQPPQVRPATFTGAFQSILNKQGTYDWAIRPLVRLQEFGSWRQTVEAVTEFSFVLRRPNPNYADREEVEHLVESLELEVVRLVGHGSEGVGVNTEGTIFQQAMDHVRRGYGKASVKGRDESGQESEWKSTDGGSVPFRARVESESEDRLDEGELVDPLREMGGTSEALIEVDLDDDSD